MLDQQLCDAWRAQERAVSISPVMRFVEDGLVLGAGTVLVARDGPRRLQSTKGQKLSCWRCCRPLMANRLRQQCWAILNARRSIGVRATFALRTSIWRMHACQSFKILARQPVACLLSIDSSRAAQARVRSSRLSALAPPTSMRSRNFTIRINRACRPVAALRAVSGPQMRRPAKPPPPVEQVATAHKAHLFSAECRRRRLVFSKISMRRRWRSLAPTRCVFWARSAPLRQHSGCCSSHPE